MASQARVNWIRSMAVAGWHKASVQLIGRGMLIGSATWQRFVSEITQRCERTHAASVASVTLKLNIFPQTHTHTVSLSYSCHQSLASLSKSCLQVNLIIQLAYTFFCTRKGDNYFQFWKLPLAFLYLYASCLDRQGSARPKLQFHCGECRSVCHSHNSLNSCPLCRAFVPQAVATWIADLLPGYI